MTLPVHWHRLVPGSFRAVRVHQCGGVEALAVEEGLDLSSLLTSAPSPTSSRGRLVEASPRLLVKNSFAGVNFHDTYTRSGLYRKPLPFIAGCEGAGTVLAAEPGAEEWVGQRVVYFDHSGSYSDYSIVQENRSALVPEGLGLKEALGGFVQGLTAHYLTQSTFPLKNEHTCLVLAAAGGTGQLVCQMARLANARVIGVVGSRGKLPLLEGQVDDAVVLEPGEDTRHVVQQVREMTSGQGVDVVYDSVGKDTADMSLQCLKLRGMLVLFGNASGPPPDVSALRLAEAGSVFVTRPILDHYMNTREELDWRAGEVFRWLLENKLHVNVRSFPSLESAPVAHKEIEARMTRGKIVLELEL